MWTAFALEAQRIYLETEANEQSRRDNSEEDAMSTTIRAGNYYIGDPCYCFSHEKWDAILNATNCLDEPYKEGRKVLVAFGTAFGDGEYTDQDGNKYSVDSGMLAAIPVNMVDRPDHGLRKVFFENPVECFDNNGFLHF